jgi:hypothetical protein
MGIQDSRVYLSRQVNNILQVFGSNVKISGLDITINNNNKLINNKIASFTISPGKCIVDTTLHLFPTATTLELDVSPYDSSGYLMIVVSYKYIETLQQNRPVFKLLYVTSDGLDQLPDAWSPNKDGLILGVFKFNNHTPYDIELYHGSTISLNGSVYTINPILDTTEYQHYLGGSDSEPNSDYNRWVLSNGDLYFDLVQKDLFIYNGWSPIENTFESDDNYNISSSSVTLYTLTVTKAGTGTGAIISNSNSIDCDSTCSYQFSDGTNVTLTATPDIYSKFGGWSGDVIDSSSTITVTMSSNKSVTATFNTLYTLTVTNAGSGTGTITSPFSDISCRSTCAYQFASGTSITLTATPDSSFSFGGWSGDVTSSSSTITFTINSNKNVIATFNTLYTLTVTKSGSGTGTVSSYPSGISCGIACSYQFIPDTSVTLTATPDSSSTFGGWSGDTNSISTTTTITMNSNKNVTATFNILLYTLTVTKAGSGTGTVTSNPSGINCDTICSYQFTSGTNVTLTATPGSSSVFGGWSGAVIGTNTTTTITMDSDKSVTAIFNSNYTLIITKAGTGTGTVTSNPTGINCGSTCIYQFVDGTNVTLIATPDSSSTFGGWSGDTICTNTTVTITMDSNKSVTATFLYTLTLTVTKSGTGTGTVSSNPSGINCGSTCSYHFASDSVVTLTATPDSSSSFGGWSGDATGTSSTVTIIMNSDKSVTAIFNVYGEAGYFAGGRSDTVYYSFIDKLLFSNESRTTLAATLSQSILYQSACNSSLAGYFAGGYNSGDIYHNFIDKLLFSNDSRTTLTVTLSYTVSGQSACNSTLAGYFAGGNNSYIYQSFIDKLLFSNEYRSTLTVILSQSTTLQSACNSTLSGYFSGGFHYDGNSYYYSFIDKLLFSNDSRSTLSTTLSRSVECQSACNSTLAGYLVGGSNTWGSIVYSFIDKLSFSNESQSTLSVTLSRSINSQSACNSTLAGYFAGGEYYDNGNYFSQSVIDKLLFSNESRSTLTATSLRTIYGQSACQSGGIL